MHASVKQTINKKASAKIDIRKQIIRNAKQKIKLQYKNLFIMQNFIFFYTFKYFQLDLSYLFVFLFNLKKKYLLNYHNYIIILISIMIKIYIILLFIAHVVSWSQFGHLMTAAIAQIRLKQISPDVFVKFSNLATSINRLCDSKSQTMIQSACWPDDIKGYDSFWNSWHFINTPYLYQSVIPILNYTQTISNSLNIVNNAQKILKMNVENNSAERALMARYLIHLVGDIHQPLHSVAMFSNEFPEGDQGGNKITIKAPNGSSYNFHTFWDQGGYLFENSTYKIVRPMNAANYSSLMKIASQIINQYGSEVEGLAQNLDPQVWAWESYEYALNTTYPSVLQNTTITQNYVDLTFQTSKKRVATAGYRLANFVLDIYSTKLFQAEHQKDVKSQMEWLFKTVKNIELDQIS